MSGLRIGSLCSGYGGLDMAVQAVFGGSLAWVADNDAGACRILAHHHPRVPNLGDITAARWGEVEPVDIVTGGYPCQPFSSAGKRKGVADERHIWPDIARALGVLRPRLAVFENVAGHLSLGFDTVLGDLAALGFDARWCTLRASDVGAAHQRKRLFVLAWPADSGSTGLQGRRAARTASDRRRIAPSDPVDLGEHRSRTRGTGRDEPAPRRLAAAHPARVGEREPTDPAQPLAGSGHARQEPGSRDGLAPADPAGHGRLERRGLAHGSDGSTGAVRQGQSPRDGAECVPQGPAEWGEYAEAVARWEAVLQRPAPGPVDAVGRLSPAFVEWLMGLPAGHVTDVPGLSRSAQLRALGNGVVPQQATAALRFLAPAALPTRTAA
ncbi:DNA cytosine methyltransferase [Streptomyces olivaceus]|nr:DNA cytosine methyltransferase [Streptomyces olivaceus]MBZ6164180.1 DNA cytosine methyltransferase [Streptomyces olivaceus]